MATDKSVWGRTRFLEYISGLILVGFLSTAQAAIVANIDIFGDNDVSTADNFGSGQAGTTYVGQGAYSDPGNDSWNTYGSSDGFGSKALTASDGVTATGWSFKQNDPGAMPWGGGYYNFDFGGFFSDGSNALLNDGHQWHPDATDNDFIISGLDPTESYDIYLYGTSNELFPGGGEALGAQITDAVGTVDASVQTGISGSDPHFTLDQTYTLTTGVVPTAAGEILIEQIIGGVVVSQSDLAGIQIVSGGIPPRRGDCNGDGDVDELDLRKLLDNYFITDPVPGHDDCNFTNLGDVIPIVDEKDYLIWEEEFLISGGVLPEPSSLVLLIPAGLALFSRSRRQRTAAR